jgi:hypothetical protein
MYRFHRSILQMQNRTGLGKSGFFRSLNINSINRPLYNYKVASSADSGPEGACWLRFWPLSGLRPYATTLFRSQYSFLILGVTSRENMRSINLQIPISMIIQIFHIPSHFNQIHLSPFLTPTKRLRKHAKAHPRKPSDQIM